MSLPQNSLCPVEQGLFCTDNTELSFCRTAVCATTELGKAVSVLGYGAEKAEP